MDCGSLPPELEVPEPPPPQAARSRPVARGSATATARRRRRSIECVMVSLSVAPEHLTGGGTAPDGEVGVVSVTELSPMNNVSSLMCDIDAVYGLARRGPTFGSGGNGLVSGSRRADVERGRGRPDAFRNDAAAAGVRPVTWV